MRQNDSQKRNPYTTGSPCTNAMEDLTEVREEFQSVDGIDANPPNTPVSSERILVKVTDESAIGRFYGKARELGVELTSVSRNGLSYTALDAWASLAEDDE